jgi:hypothetical protein
VVAESLAGSRNSPQAIRELRRYAYAFVHGAFPLAVHGSHDAMG